MLPINTALSARGGDGVSAVQICFYPPCVGHFHEGGAEEEEHVVHQKSSPDKLAASPAVRRQKKKKMLKSEIREEVVMQTFKKSFVPTSKVLS